MFDLMDLDVDGIVTKDEVIARKNCLTVNL